MKAQNSLKVFWILEERNIVGLKVLDLNFKENCAIIS